MPVLITLYTKYTIARRGGWFFTGEVQRVVPLLVDRRRER